MKPNRQEIDLTKDIIRIIKFNYVYLPTEKHVQALYFIRYTLKIEVINRIGTKDYILGEQECYNILHLNGYIYKNLEWIKDDKPKISDEQLKLL